MPSNEFIPGRNKNARKREIWAQKALLISGGLAILQPLLFDLFDVTDIIRTPTEWGAAEWLSLTVATPATAAAGLWWHARRLRRQSEADLARSRGTGGSILSDAR